ncbi:PREDICTED: homeobox protein PKNOX2-like, partial [Rhagoletis zephyria]|uniref:homeobox protein PKNOX2-like n=1 Tax=Rhagoletis zephyria TaxID=28612 RepID=UPI00081187EB
EEEEEEAEEKEDKKEESKPKEQHDSNSGASESSSSSSPQPSSPKINVTDHYEEGSDQKSNLEENMEAKEDDDENDENDEVIRNSRSPQEKTDISSLSARHLFACIGAAAAAAAGATVSMTPTPEEEEEEEEEAAAAGSPTDSSAAEAADVTEVAAQIGDTPLSSSSSSSFADLKQLESDKKAVYSHPLFPLLALLFEKCELATQSINAFDSDPSLSAFNNEIGEFIEHQQKLGRPLLTDDPEVDSLMMRSIQVFRIHLLELEKVSELCKDFCHRYISCLRSKMRSDVLLRGAGSSSTADDELVRAEDILSGSTTGSTTAAISAAAAAAARKVPAAHKAKKTSGEKQSTGGGHSKRGVLPKQATSIMRSWLFQHIVHPYPTEDEKRAIASQTSLTLLQVNNWFINARRRILQPMLDSANTIHHELVACSAVTGTPVITSSSSTELDLSLKGGTKA